MALRNYFKPKQSAYKTLPSLFIFAILVATLIYWREDEVRNQVSFFHVLLWQSSIWIPWVLAYWIIEKIQVKYLKNKYLKILLYGAGILWVGIHFIWFFYLSSNFSPYLGMPATGYGVYPYFFIFWTIVDIGLTWVVIEKTKPLKEKDSISKPKIFELSRGDKKFFCEANQIHWLSAEGYHTKLYTDQGNFVIRKTLKDFCKKLPQGEFKRIHRSTVINVHQVSGLARGKNDSLEVILKDGSRRRVSRNYTKEVRAFFRGSSF